MPIDPNHFFREATLRICGSLEIEKALYACLMVIRDYLPAGQMAFHCYHRELGIVETVAHATVACGRLVSIRTPLSEDAQRQVQAQRSIRVRLIDRLVEDPVTGPVAMQLGVSDRSAVVMDLVVERTFLGIVSVFDNGREVLDATHVRLLGLLNKPFAIALTNSLRYREMRRLKDLLADDNRYLQDELRRMSGNEIIGADFGLRGVMEQVRQVAPLDSPVLLLGETGTGKEIVASAIHNLSSRRNRPLIKVNCGAIPPTLMDSELFGYEKGAFTGADARKRGRIERADGGTLFLDEIGELQPKAQVRLLRVLQEKEIDRIGGSGPVRVDIRVIAATHRHLETLIRQERFRKDLYFRLKVFPIELPPLRKRRSDIPVLVQHFIQKKAQEMKMAKVPLLATDAIDRLMSYEWPGNVRELENAVERALILCRGAPLTFSDLTPESGALSAEQGSPDAFEPTPPMELDTCMASHISRVLDMCGGQVEGSKGAAERLHIHPSTLRKRMRKLGIPFGRRAKTQTGS